MGVNSGSQAVTDCTAEVGTKLREGMLGAPLCR